MINLGLGRIKLLLEAIAISQGQTRYLPSWKVIHIAGTNGKGSVAAYLSALFRITAKHNLRTQQLDRTTGSTGHAVFRFAQDDSDMVKVGRFTSPHFIDRWDSIMVNDKPVRKEDFLQTERDLVSLASRIKAEAVEQADGNHGAGQATLQPTSFEFLTASAFNLFSVPASKPCEVAVVECGLGGRLDATNALPDEAVAVSVITRIGLDHLDLLGGSLHGIVREKLGILRRDVPVIIDGDNTSEVLEMIRKEITDKFGAEWHETMVKYSHASEFDRLIRKAEMPSSTELFAAMAPHQRSNLHTAWMAYHEFWRITTGHYPAVQPEEIFDVLTRVIHDAGESYPGRLQWLRPGWTADQALAGIGSAHVLLDGAHNKQSADALRRFVDEARKKSQPEKFSRIVWVLAISDGKDIEEILRTLVVGPMDHVVFTRFGPVDGMPWVKSATLQSLQAATQKVGLDHDDREIGYTENIVEALQHVQNKAFVLQGENTKSEDNRSQTPEEIVCSEIHRPLIVVAGSLYLVSNLLRFMRDGREEFTKYWIDSRNSH